MWYSVYVCECVCVSVAALKFRIYESWDEIYIRRTRNIRNSKNGAVVRIRYRRPALTKSTHSLTQNNQPYCKFDCIWHWFISLISSVFDVLSRRNQNTNGKKKIVYNSGVEKCINRLCLVYFMNIRLRTPSTALLKFLFLSFHCFLFFFHFMCRLIHNVDVVY